MLMLMGAICLTGLFVCKRQLARLLRMRQRLETVGG